MRYLKFLAKFEPAPTPPDPPRRKSRIPCLGRVVRGGPDGDDFDCDYEHAGAVSCEQCTVNGGSYSPRTGRRSRDR